MQPVLPAEAIKLMAGLSRMTLAVVLLGCALVAVRTSHAQVVPFGTLPEERQIRWRNPASLPRTPIPADAQPPPTVSRRPETPPQTPLELDAAIRQALANSDVIRVLTGVGATNSGQSIFDPAIATARIDQQQALFDPRVDLTNDFLRTEPPLQPNRTDAYDLRLDAVKPLYSGGRFNVGVDVDRTRQQPFRRLLDPQTRSSASLGFVQPLLQGAGVNVNMVPIVLARIDAESSYFRLKGAVQESVRGVIQAYWDLVAARTQTWAIEQQVKQAEFAVRLESARMRVGTSDVGQLSQANLALANFRANLIASQSNVLDREATLRSILGLPPTSPEELVPMSQPVTTRYEFDWEGLLQVAERNRPDLIELKLILEADFQQLLRARNQALPQLDAVALYRWNGLEGELPTGAIVRSEPGAFTDWQLGVNFSVPLGLRAGRAGVRESELLIARDRANIDQAMLEIVHEIAASVRQLDQQFSQYEALRETRLAAIENLKQQTAGFRNERIEFINVLQALTDWGNAVSAEAQSLSQYNAELARLELLTGTILEAHGVRFYEERFESLGPLGLLHHTACYPRDLRPSPNLDRYPTADQPVDQLFREDAPEELLERSRRTRVLPPTPDMERLPEPE
jgi:outer membrane protein TolC